MCKCGSNRILFLSAHSRDCTFISYQGVEHSGYVPYGLNIGGSDDVELSLCMDCGYWQEFKPLTDSQIIEVFG